MNKSYTLLRAYKIVAKNIEVSELKTAIEEILL